MEIVIRALVVFAFLWLITRAVGRSTLGELSTFELLLYVTMGDLVQQSITQQDYSVTAGLLAVGTFALLTVALSWSQWWVPRLRAVVTGRPVLVFADGAPVEGGMRRERLSAGDLLVAARQQGIRRTTEIEYAVLEADGRISFFTKGPDDEGAPEKPPPSAAGPGARRAARRPRWRPWSSPGSGRGRGSGRPAGMARELPRRAAPGMGAGDDPPLCRAACGRPQGGARGSRRRPAGRRGTRFVSA